jgi:hypothetical protein
VATRTKKPKTTTEPASEAVQSDPVGEPMQTIGEAIADATGAGLLQEAADPSTTVAEDPEWGTEGHAQAFMLGNLMELFKRHFCRLAEPWGRLREEEQARALKYLHMDLQDEVRKAVRIIAGNARVSFRAEVESVQFKGASDIKAVLKLIGGPEAHSLADAAGNYVTVLIESLDELLAVPEAALQGEPDIKPLFDESTAGSSLDVDPEEVEA